MTELKKLWDEGIGQWCKSVQGVFSRSKIQPWIKNCDLPGDHQLIFWNNGNEEKHPKEIAVRFYPKEGGHITIGDLEKIEGNCIDAKETLHFNGFFAQSELRGRFCKTETGWKLFAGIHHERKDFNIRESLTSYEFQEVKKLENELFEKEGCYKKIHADYRLKYKKALDDDTLDSDEFKKIAKENDQAAIICSKIEAKISKIREHHPTLTELRDMGVKHVRIKFPSGRIEEYDLDVLLKED